MLSPNARITASSGILEKREKLRATAGKRMHNEKKTYKWEIALSQPNKTLEAFGVL